MGGGGSIIQESQQGKASIRTKQVIYAKLYHEKIRKISKNKLKTHGTKHAYIPRTVQIKPDC